jgi:Putative beta-barrel porin-2, OmpL-like. bbp2
MKFNKWTLGLAAVGAVSLTSVAQAEEKVNVLQTAMTSTTISGYVDTSIQFNGGGTDFLPGYSFGGPSKANGFNLNVVQLSIAKALDEGEWASGYRADLWFGPDANFLNTASVGFTAQDVAIRQAYVALRTPVGNGIDWKIGVMDGIIGYETTTSGGNPNMTRSYGYTIEPTTQTGLLGTYRFCDAISASFGIANEVGPTINERAVPPSWKAYTGSVALTAPSDWGWLAGSTLYSGFISGFDDTASGARNNYYLGATVATPVAGLKAGAAIDYAHIRGGSTASSVVSGASSPEVNNQYGYALYASYQATEKMSLHGRAEWYRQQGQSTAADPNPGANNNVTALTGTIQYDLWQNVLSRLEARWDQSSGAAYGDAGDLQHNAFMIAANVIYNF